MFMIRIFSFFCLIISTSLTAAMSPAFANESSDTPINKSQVQALTPAQFTPAIALSPQETHSGYKLPRWVSLKYDTINGRKGPGSHFPHLWTFRRKGMPVIVINEMDNWRKIRDIEGGESWVRNVALSGQNMGLITQLTPLLKKPKASAVPIAQLSPNVMLIIKSCADDYCAVQIEPEIKKGKKKGRKGYVARRNIWGAERF